MEEDTNPEQVLIQKENISDYYKKIETKLSSFEKDVMELYRAERIMWRSP